MISSLLPNFVLWLWCLATLVLVRSHWGPLIKFISILLFWFFASQPFADLLLYPLESQYAPPSIKSLHEQGVRHVVVLTGGGYPVKGVLNSSALPHASMTRFLGGLEVCQSLDDCVLIFSGSSGPSSQLPTALVMQNLALSLNPEWTILAEANSNRTADHPANLKAWLTNTPFILVTSASHMPRSMQIFRDAGLHPIPYPVDYLGQNPFGWQSVLPSAQHLQHVHHALREYFATAYSHLK